MKPKDRVNIGKSVLKLVYFGIAILFIGFIGINYIYADIANDNSDDDYVDVIVEMEKPPVLSSYTPSDVVSLSENEIKNINSFQAELKEIQQEIVDQLKQEDISVKRSYEYTLVYNGMALQVPKDKKDVILELSGVKNVHADETFYSNIDESIPLIEAPEVWDQTDQDGNHVTGRGVTVAVIDTGIDYTHQDLGGGFGEDFKVVGGYDYVNNDSDPMDDNGHGTHVAGIVAADGEITGVAPDAKLLAYKSLDQNGNGYLSDILAALEDIADPAAEHRADVVNLSLSGPGDENSPLSRAAAEVVKAGITVVAAAGNAGPGKQTINAPGSAEEVITVGASISGVYIPKISILSPIEKDLDSIRLGFSANPPDDLIESEVVDVGDGAPEDYDGIDVSGKTVLISSLNMYNAAVIAENQGAINALFYKETPSPPVSVPEGEILSNPHYSHVENFSKKQHEFLTGNAFDGRLESLVALEVTEETANELKRLMEDQTVNISMTSEDATDEIPAFSSQGPTANYRLKPDIVAPGVEIKSTVPVSVFNEEYYRMSGTSMAAPHVAGGVALMKQLYPQRSAEELSSSIVNSADPLELYNINIRGSGRLNINQASKTDVLISPESLSFGLADVGDKQFEKSKTATLTNHSEEEVTFHLSVNGELPSDAEVTVEPSTVTIDSGDEVDIEVEIAGERPDHDTDYMGWIEAVPESDTHHPVLQIPFYLGAYFLQVYTSPDPAYGNSEAFIYSPVELSEEPVVTVTNPEGETNQVIAGHDHGLWWRASLNLENPGIHKIAVNGVTEDAIHLNGTALVESLEDDDSGTYNWESIGPNGVGGRQLLNPGENKWVTTDTNQPGMFVSDNDMNTWEEIRSLPVAGGFTQATVVDPVNNNNMYVAINGDLADPTYTGKILASRDGGKNWSTLSFPDIELRDLDISSNGEVIVASTINSIYISVDKGSNWRLIPRARGEIEDIHIVNSNLFFSSGNGLYVVKDFARNHERVEQIAEVDEGSIDLIAGNNDMLFFTSYYPHHVYASEDGGNTWNIIKDSRYRITMLEYENNNIFVNALSTIEVSFDNGYSWQEWDDPLPGLIVYDAVAPEPDGPPQKSIRAYFTSPYGGIFETNDSGNSYERIGVPGADVEDMLLMNNGEDEYIFAGTQWETYQGIVQDNHSVNDSIAEWGNTGNEGYIGVTTKLLDSPAKDSNVAFKVNKDALSSFLIYKSEDWGDTWELITRGSEEPYEMLIHPADPNRIYISYWALSGSGLLSSDDGGENWREIPRDNPAQAIAGDPEDPNKIWLGDNGGLYVSEDGGETFSQLDDTPISSISVDPQDSNHLVLGGRSLYHSYDGGHTVEISNYTDLSIYVNDLLISKNDSNIVYASAGSFSEAGLLKGGRGVLRSTDGGETWESISSGIPNKDTTSLELSEDEKYLYTGTKGGSVYRINLSQLGNR